MHLQVILKITFLLFFKLALLLIAKLMRYSKTIFNWVIWTMKQLIKGNLVDMLSLCFVPMPYKPCKCKTMGRTRFLRIDYLLKIYQSQIEGQRSKKENWYCLIQLYNSVNEGNSPVNKCMVCSWLLHHQIEDR